jgi:hypothetical protein
VAAVAAVHDKTMALMTTTVFRNGTSNTDASTTNAPATTANVANVLIAARIC